jgi:ubiquinone/menaquinone biosynthesis C-methylase UbiE
MSNEKVVETFDRWVEDGRDEGLEKGHGNVVRQVIEKMQIAPGEKVLDLGCGTGWATRLIAKANAGVQAIGVDASPRMIAKADELHSFTIRARYDFCSFEKLDFKDAEFDRIFSMEAIYYTTDLDKTLSEAFRVLRPGGASEILLDYYEESPASADWGEVMGLKLQRLTEAGWKQAFEKAGFQAVSTSRVVDSRGPGDRESFERDECEPNWDAKVALHEAGTLWVHAEKA